MKTALTISLIMNLLFTTAFLAIGLGAYRVLNEVREDCQQAKSRLTEIESRFPAVQLPGAETLKEQAKDAAQKLKERYLGK